MNAPIPAECAERSRKGKIVCAENRCKITFLNRAKREVVKYCIDGCPRLRSLLEDPGRKLCDYLVAVESLGQQHYVELKGKNVEHALAQIESTIAELRSLNPENLVYCWIIATESPRESSHFQVQRLRFERRLKARVKIHTFKCEHDLA